VLLPLSSGTEVRRVSSRHDDECRNVRLEARNTVCSSASRIYGEYYTPGLPESTGVYEISRLRVSPGAFASTLDLFALHFARFSTRKSASASPTRRLAPRNTLPPSFDVAAWRKFACVFVGRAKRAATVVVIRGKIRCSLASKAASRRRTVNVPFSSSSHILQRALSSYISPVCRK